MPRVDYDPDRAFEALRPVMVDRVSAMGEESASHAATIAPRKTGRLARSIGWALVLASRTMIVARFGTELLYGRFKEIGTHRMPPASFLRRTGIELIDRYKAIAKRGR